jgi:hypothetical protein
MSSMLQEHGFDTIEQVHQCDAVEAALWDRSDAIRPRDLSVLTHARVRDR